MYYYGKVFQSSESYEEILSGSDCFAWSFSKNIQQRWWIMCTKGIRVECRSITSINTQSIPNRHSINTLVNTWPTIDRLLIKCQMSVDWVRIATLVEYRSRSHLRVSIDTWLQMLLVYMIQDGYKTVYLPGCSRPEWFWFPLSTQSCPLMPIQFFHHVSNKAHFTFMFVHRPSRCIQCPILVCPLCFQACSMPTK